MYIMIALYSNVTIWFVVLQETFDVINGVNVRVLQPRDVNNENKPAIIFYHGGGFYTGSVCK